MSDPFVVPYSAGAEQALELANERGWVAASIKDDCATVFDTP